MVDKNSTDSFIEHLEKVIKRLKNLAKKREKDITILFSRYDHGFNTQLNQLNIVKNYIQSKPKTTQNK